MQSPTSGPVGDWLEASLRMVDGTAHANPLIILCAWRRVRVPFIRGSSEGRSCRAIKGPFFKRPDPTAPRFPADAPSLLRGIPAPVGHMDHAGGRWPCSLQVSAISHTLELQPLTIHQSSPEPVSKLLSAGIPTCLLFVQAMMTSVPNSPRFAASYHLDCWPLRFYSASIMRSSMR